MEARATMTGEGGESLIDTRRFKAIQEQARERARNDSEAACTVTRGKVWLISNQLREAQLGQHTIRCDETAERGGGGEHPTPMQYFVAATGF